MQGPISTPTPAGVCVPSPLVGGGGHTRLQDRGWGFQFGRGDRHYGPLVYMYFVRTPEARPLPPPPIHLSTLPSSHKKQSLDEGEGPRISYTIRLAIIPFFRIYSGEGTVVYST
jgi:hypothetical protein